MKRNVHQVRQHADKHSEAHSNLKQLLKDVPVGERIWPIFVATFLIVLISVTIFNNWNRIINVFTLEKTTVSQVETRGIQKGVLGTYKFNHQASAEYRKFLTNIPSDGSKKGLKAASSFGEGKKETTGASVQDAVKAATELSTGQP